jgi:hypothetical protein
MHANLGFVYSGPFSDLFNLPGNIIQYLFPSTTPSLDTTVSEAYQKTLTPAAPQTEAKMTDWTVADLYESQAQKGQVGSSMLQAAAGQQQTTANVADNCSWYQTANSAGQCSFGSTMLWIAAAGAAAAVVYMGRR